jgi:hypothetical protein
MKHTGFLEGNPSASTNLKTGCLYCFRITFGFKPDSLESLESLPCCAGPGLPSRPLGAPGSPPGRTHNPPHLRVDLPYPSGRYIHVSAQQLQCSGTGSVREEHAGAMMFLRYWIRTSLHRAKLAEQGSWQAV